MYMNLMELIKEARPGTYLRSKGGEGHSYSKFVFIKYKKNTVRVFTGHTWYQINSLSKQYEAEECIGTITPEGITLKLEKRKNNDNWRHQSNQYLTWNISSFFSLGLLYNCRTRWSYGSTLVVCNIDDKPVEVMPFKSMTFDWKGNLVSKVPKWALNAYDKWDRNVKDKRNAGSRIRYAQAKVEREFKKYEKDGKVNDFPVEKVFQIRNSQFRSYAINAIGLERALSPYPIEVIDKATVDGRPYELVEIEIPDIVNYNFGRENTSHRKKCLYLKMTNPSTAEYHLEGVPRKSDNSWDHIPEETVMGALAWRDGEQPERQGIGHDKKISEWKYIQPSTIT